MKQADRQGSWWIFASAILTIAGAVGCASVQPAPQQMSNTPSSAKAAAAPSETAYVLYVDSSANCGQDPCNGTLIAFDVTSDGSLSNPHAPTSVTSPVLDLAWDKARGRLAIENPDFTLSAGSTLAVLQASTAGGPSTLGSARLGQQSALRFHPNGQWVYRVDNGPWPLGVPFNAATDQLEAFSTTQGLAPTSASATFDWRASDVVFSNAGDFMYVVSWNGQLDTFSIDSSGNAHKTDSTTLPGDFAGFVPSLLAVHPSGQWLYVQAGPLNLIVFEIQQDGSLTFQSRLPVSLLARDATQSPVSVLFQDVFEPSGRFAFAGSQIYSIDQRDGSVHPSGEYTSNSVYSVDVDPSGQYLYTVGFPEGGTAAEISGFKLNIASGQLTVTPLPGAPFQANTSLNQIPYAVMVVANP